MHILFLMSQLVLRANLFQNLCKLTDITLVQSTLTGPPALACWTCTSWDTCPAVLALIALKVLLDQGLP
jgi:hypothetical protein